MTTEKRLKVAGVVTSVLGPLPMGVVLALAVGIQSGRGALAGAAWGLLCVVCAAILPALAAVPLRRLPGRTPSVRVAYMTPAVVGAALGLGALYVLDAPMSVRVLALGLAAGLVLSAAINTFYASSNHVAALSGGVALATSLLSAWCLLLFPLVLLLGWSRVVVGAHDWPQVRAGTLVGVASVLFVVSIWS